MCRSWMCVCVSVQNFIDSSFLKGALKGKSMGHSRDNLRCNLRNNLNGNLRVNLIMRGFNILVIGVI